MRLTNLEQECGWVTGAWVVTTKWIRGAKNHLLFHVYMITLFWTCMHAWLLPAHKNSSSDPSAVSPFIKFPWFVVVAPVCRPAVNCSATVISPCDSVPVMMQRCVQAPRPRHQTGGHKQSGSISLWVKPERAASIVASVEKRLPWLMMNCFKRQSFGGFDWFNC